MGTSHRLEKKEVKIYECVYFSLSLSLPTYLLNYLSRKRGGGWGKKLETIPQSHVDEQLVAPTLSKPVVGHIMDLWRSKRNETNSLRAKRNFPNSSFVLSAVGEQTQIFPVPKQGA